MRMPTCGSARIFLLLLVVCSWMIGAMLPAHVHAQEAPPWPGPPLPPPIPIEPPIVFNQQVVVERHTVDAVIEGQVAQVEVTQVLRNSSGRVAEGVYVFPLPVDATVSDFQMTVDDQTLEGRLLDRNEARRIYEQIVRTQRDPALLEYLGRGLFQTSVFPIPPGETRTVRLTYTQLLERKDRLHRFNYPLRASHPNAGAAEEIALRIELRNLSGLRTIYSPNYPITIERLADDHAVVFYQAAGAEPTADFDLYFGVETQPIGIDLLSYKPAGEDGYFLLLAAPALEAAAEEVVARDLIVVIDVSGSMQGKKIQQAKEAVRYIVQNLNSEDRFNLIAFSTGVSLWEKTLQPVAGRTQESAMRWIDKLRATGSTDINRALLEALAQLDAEDLDRPAYILFLTDGQPTQGEMNADAIVRNALNNLPGQRSVRLFTFGVGYDVNTDLLDVLADELRGASHYVKPNEAIDEAVSTFYAQVSTPVLADIRLDFGQAIFIEDVYPHPLPDLFAGRQLVVVGRYREGGEVEVTLSGRVNNKEKVYVYPQRTLVESGGEPFVAQLWATRKIGHLLAQIRRTGPDPELVQAVIDLSLQYGILTPYTSYLVLEPDVPVLPLDVTTQAPAQLALPDAAQLRTQGIEIAAQAHAAPAAGEAAVSASQGRSAFIRAETAQTTSSEMRYVAGRTFILRAYIVDAEGRQLPLWVDTRYHEEMETAVVKFAGDAYFDLLDEPGMAQALALSPEMIIVTDDGKAIRITTSETME
ncbi:MAG: VIT domain-containing protein [Caldilinea sp.]|nr:VIT domain-containing protein [Caldilinea sp.]MDW8440363.1 VIT domain-containing protein [Caldilineaceae bacterium]